MNLDRWVGLAGNIVAPAGAVTALLFYFGYASTRAKYEYFGVDIDTVGLDTRGFLMRSPQPLLVPTVLLAVLTLLGLWLHFAVYGLIERADGHPGERRLRAFRRTAVAVLLVGVLILLAGVTLVVIYPWLRNWPVYDMITPICLLVGVSLVVYGRHSHEHAAAIGAPRREALETRITRLRRMILLLCAVVVAGSAFWASSTLAQWSGRGQAVRVAERFHELPNVILDTRERLYIRDPVIRESVLPQEEGQTYRYRYRNLRLLVHGADRMFLVPDTWSNSGSTLVVPMDDSIRVQFQFQNPG